MNAEARLIELGIRLPEYPRTVGKYVQAVLFGDMLHIAGHGPARVEGIPVTGKIGSELTIEQGIVAARQVGLNTLAIEAPFGDIGSRSQVCENDWSGPRCAQLYAAC
ncbi:RidA family protein [Bradyrhizobium sp. B117]|uniref:RidA family protein n=1 Tax=Bradyrhizobium sp. B117 TaxID=3140246 RepID=UPI00318380F5